MQALCNELRSFSSRTTRYSFGSFVLLSKDSATSILPTRIAANHCCLRAVWCLQCMLVKGHLQHPSLHSWIFLLDVLRPIFSHAHVVVRRSILWPLVKIGDRPSELGSFLRHCAHSQAEVATSRLDCCDCRSLSECPPRRGGGRQVGHQPSVDKTTQRKEVVPPWDLILRVKIKIATRYLLPAVYLAPGRVATGGPTNFSLQWRTYSKQSLVFASVGPSESESGMLACGFNRKLMIISLKRSRLLDS